MNEPIRCVWSTSNPLMMEYHDREWGVPAKDDVRQFEHHILEIFQSGLSWLTILKRREGFRNAFAGFQPEDVTHFGQRDVERLLEDEKIIRNRRKIEAAVNNAGRFIEISSEFGDFHKFLAQFKPEKTAVYKALEEIPPHTPESMALSEELKKRGFKFVGPTTCYAHMQSVGIVNDHLESCFRFGELNS